MFFVASILLGIFFKKKKISNPNKKIAKLTNKKLGFVFGEGKVHQSTWKCVYKE